MKVKQATAYAMHAMMYMVRHVTQLPVTAETVARAEQIPPRYLAKILPQLARAGFLKTAGSRRKGYVFARDPQDIRLLELIEAIEGRPLFGHCFMRHGDCPGAAHCNIYAVWKKSTAQMSSYLAHTSLAAAAWDHPDHRFDAVAAKRPGS
jgi:Rrf2 family protein